MHDFKTIERFIKKLSLDYDTGCWNWTGYLNGGYGAFCIGGPIRTNRVRKAHRVAWEIYNGEIPDGMCVCHHCDNPKCCNPNHLWLGTHKQNMEDMKSKGRLKYNPAKSGELHHNNKFAEMDITSMREMYAKGYTQDEIATIFNTSQPVVSAIVNHKRWKHLP